MKKTYLYQRHLEAHARVVDFAGWALPIEYQSVLNETLAVRLNCGLFDVSHMGQIFVSGDGALNYLQRLVTNDLFQIHNGQLQYNLFLNEQGFVLDDLMVYRISDYELMCVVNASNADKIYQWMGKQKPSEIKLENKTLQSALLALQGPKAEAIMCKMFSEQIKNIGYMEFCKEDFLNQSVIVSRSGYTGEDGFELYLPQEVALKCWDDLIQIGKEFSLSLVGLGARDILRIEAGYPLYGHELTEQINPYQAALSWAVKTSKDFIGRNALVRFCEQGIDKKRVGFIMKERALPRQGYEIYAEGKVVGEVSSGTYSPNCQAFIGMAFVNLGYSKCGQEIEIEVRNRKYKAEIVKFPFIKPGVKRTVGTGPRACPLT